MLGPGTLELNVASRFIYVGHLFHNISAGLRYTNWVSRPNSVRGQSRQCHKSHLLLLHRLEVRKWVLRHAHQTLAHCVNWCDSLLHAVACERGAAELPVSINTSRNPVLVSITNFWWKEHRHVFGPEPNAWLLSLPKKFSFVTKGYLRLHKANENEFRWACGLVRAFPSKPRT